VDLFFGLRGEFPENGSFLEFDWRLSEIHGPKSANVSLQRLLAMRKARISQTFLIKQRKFSENKNVWLATRWYANQSPRKFPANREFYREFSGFGPKNAHFAAETVCAAATFRSIPCAN
jgi:hypothetical protein